jgi:hypothetical protein
MLFTPSYLLDEYNIKNIASLNSLKNHHGYDTFIAMRESNSFYKMYGFFDDEKFIVIPKINYS